MKLSNTTDLNLRHFFVQVSLTFVRQAFSVVCQLVFVILLARVLGPEGNGQYTVAVSLSMLVVNLLSFGVPAANVFFIGKGSVSARTVFMANLKIWGVLILIGALVSTVLVGGFSTNLFKGIPPRLLWLSLAFFPLTLMYTLLASILQGRQDFTRYNATLILPAVVSLAAAVVFVYLMGLGVTGGLLSWGLGQCAGLVSALVSVRPHIRDEIGREVKNVSYIRPCLNYGWKAHASNVISFLNYRLDLFLVNLFVGPTGSGIYSVAIQITERLWLLSQAVSTVLLPRLSELHTDETARMQLTPLVARWVTYIGFFCAVLLAIFVRPLVHLLFGPSYEKVAVALFFLLPGVVTFSCARVLANDIAARGRPEINIWTAGIALTVSLVCNILLIPRYGINGASLAVTIAFSLSTIVTMSFYSHLSGNNWLRPIMIEDIDRRLFSKLMAHSGLMRRL